MLRKQDKLNRLGLCLVFTALFGLAAHAACYFGRPFSHDALMVYQDDDLWQISLGRFLQPLYRLLRGSLSAPFLLGLLSLFWLGLCAWLLVRLFDLRTKPAIALCCGLLATNAALALTNASYIAWADVFMLALLLATLSVFLFQRFRFGFLFGALPLAMSLALYQGYVGAAVLLLLMLLVQTLLQGGGTKSTLLAGLRALCMLLLGGLLYAGAFWLLLKVRGAAPSDSYNGLAGLGDWSGHTIPQLLWQTFWHPIRYFLHPETYNSSLSALLTLLLLALSALGAAVTVRARRLTAPAAALAALLILLMPLGMNAVYFFSKGMVHSLMYFPFVLIYIFPLFLDRLYQDEAVLASAPSFFRKCLTPLRGAAALAFALLLLNNIVFSNQIYLKKELEYDRTLSVMTRMVDRMEETPGYIPGETPVVLVGTLDASPILAHEAPGFAHLDGVGLQSPFAVSYYKSYDYYFSNVLNYPVLLVDGQLRESLAQKAEVQALPIFPDPGACRLMDGMLFLRLS